MRLVLTSAVSTENLVTRIALTKPSEERECLTLQPCLQGVAIEDVDMYEGNINGDIFTNFIVQSLVPILQPCDDKNSRSVVYPYVVQVATLIQNTFIFYHHTALITIPALEESSGLETHSMD